jgi:hypothetical protein
MSFSVDALYTGSVTTAAQLISANFGLDLVDYWILEYAWNKFGPRAGTLEAVPELEFAAAGVDGRPNETAIPLTEAPAKPVGVPSAN